MSSMKLPWLNTDTPFPPVSEALEDPPGLLAAGADLSIARLQDAYSQGIFPWYQEGEPLLWWSLAPRMVLACDAFKPSHSLRKRLRQIARQQQQGNDSLQVRVDTALGEVLHACSRCDDPDRHGVWLTQEMQRAYLAWHRAGQVHSIETWRDGKLIGGLYGVSLGKMFFGESMFSRETDASKIALAHLVAFLRTQGVAWIDCQMQTAHLSSMGATPVSREQFLAHIHQACAHHPIDWKPGWIDANGQLHAEHTGSARHK
jgi:leucyl/phenylalanyl-tRNA--protein transferase